MIGGVTLRLTPHGNGVAAKMVPDKAVADHSSLLIQILDPCLPVSLTQVMESEVDDA